MYILTMLLQDTKTHGLINIEVIKDLVNPFMQDIIGRNQAGEEPEVKINVPSQPLMLDGDHTRLVQVFSSLLNNACKYCERCGLITLTANCRDSEVLVSVIDTGVGTPQEMLPKIFELFTQVDGSLERSQGGLGIGLTLVKRLVEMHGGTIEANSEGVGKGSEFIVHLPLAIASVQVVAPNNNEQQSVVKPKRRRRQ